MEINEFKTRYASARRELIARDFPGLNDMQLKSVMATEGPLLLLAGAGSGKTTVLINRIANLIRYGRGSDTDELPPYCTADSLAMLESAVESGREPDDDVRALCAVEPAEPWRILAITFTNKAADELKSRLVKKLGPTADDIWAMTFHSACVRILRRNIEPMGFTRSFTIYDTDDSVAVMKRVLKELELDDKSFPPKTVLGYISRAKDSMQSPEDFAQEAEKNYDTRKKFIARAYAEYARRLRAADALDFDDIIYYTVRLLLENEDVRTYYQRYFRYVLVDEYQDTSRLQYMLVSTLAGGYNNICVVGDDDQSIYKFRGATIENILSFENQYQNARSIKLEQNYRSTSHILEAANAVIRNNRGRKGKELWTALGDGEMPSLYIAPSDEEEAAYVATRILEGVASGMHWSDFAVLYRMNAQSNRLEYAFKRSGIPYKVIGGTRFFDRAEIKDITSYLCVVANTSDDLRLLRIVNNPPRGIGQTTIENIRTVSANERRSLYSVMKDAALYPEFKRSSAKLESFIAMIDELVAASDTMPLDEFYDFLLEKTGYVTALGTSDDALARVDNIRELKSNIVSYMEKTESPSLHGFLDEIALYTDLDSTSDSDDCVLMMTMHSAKGLEFPWVFIVGMEDGIFPSVRSIGEEDEMEEERRLCYVALTRAKKRLFLTSARRRMLFGHTSGSMISRFIDEIPSEHLDKPNTSYRDYGSSYGEPDPDYAEYSWRESGGYGSSSGYGSYGGRSDYGSRSGYSDRSSYGGRSGNYGRSGGYSGSGTSRTASRSSYSSAPKREIPDTAKSAPLMELNVGDMVDHKVFGHGKVQSVTPMPGDALLSIEFEAGTKRLMLKTASSFMKKVDPESLF